MAKTGAADVAAILRREISKGQYRQSDRLPPSRDLAREYGVARNTVREALGRLETEGMVETRAGSGTYVLFETTEHRAEAIQNATPLELIDARFALEPHICRLCVLHGKREDFDLLDELCSRMEAAVEDPQSFSEADTKFHLALANTTRNGLLRWIIGQITSVRDQDQWNRMRQLTLNVEIINNYNAQHRQILNAIRTREPERAANLMKSHLESARLSLMRVAER